MTKLILNNRSFYETAGQFVSTDCVMHNAGTGQDFHGIAGSWAGNLYGQFSFPTRRGLDLEFEETLEIKNGKITNSHLPFTIIIINKNFAKIALHGQGDFGLLHLLTDSF